MYTYTYIRMYMYIYMYIYIYILYYMANISGKALMNGAHINGQDMDEGYNMVLVKCLFGSFFSSCW